MAQGDIGGAALVSQENETPQVPKGVIASRQESQNSLDNAESLLQRELVWNQQTSTSLEDEIKKRLMPPRDSQKKGIRGINPLWKEYEDKLNTQVREWTIYKHKMPSYKRSLEQFKKVVALLQSEWESNNNDLASVYEVFEEESDRHEYYKFIIDRFHDIKRQAETTRKDIYKIGQSQRKAKPSDSIPKPPAKHSTEYLEWCQRVGQDNPDSPTTQRFYQNRKKSVLSYIGQFRSGKIKEVLPKSALNMSVEEALIERIVDGRNISKLLGDTRDKFQR